MTFTVVTPELSSRGDVKPWASKMFVDGKSVSHPKGRGPFWWSEVKRVDAIHTLVPLYETIKEIREKKLNHVIVEEPVHTKNSSGHFRLLTSEYLEKDIKRNWILVEFDHGELGCNKLTLCQRLSSALALLPEAFQKCEMVAVLSSKSFMKAYPNYMGLHIYFRLAKPYTNAELRRLLAGLDQIDASVFSNGRRHYVAAPILKNTEREVVGEEVKYFEGGALDLQELEKDERYKKNLEHSRTMQAVTRNFVNFTPDGETMQELVRIAKEGYFDRKTRHTEHYKILKKAEWTNQNGSAVIDAILDAGSGDGTILGNVANRKTLTTKLKEIQEELREHFRYDLKSQEFDTVLTDPQECDLKKADLSEFRECISTNLELGNKVNMIVASPHGSAKTTELVPIVEEVLSNHLGRPARILYVCTLRSIIRGTAEELMFECYITEDGEIQKHVITTADKLGICIRSLARLDTRAIPFDAMIRDEAEQIGMWSLWQNGTGDVLRDYSYLNEIATHKDLKLNLLMDADAGELTYSQLQRNLTADNDISVLFENSYSWINAIEQKIHWYRKERELLNQLYDDAVTRNKFCFVHVDFDDKKSNPKLSALVNAYNTLAGREIAVAFWQGTDRKIKNKLFTDKDRYFKELHEQGIRIIIVSPIIVSGWRYRGEVNFDATYGIYLNTTQTAPAIIQRTQRVIKVSEHHLYVNPQSNYTNLEQLLEDYYYDTNYFPIEHTVYLKPNEAAAKELMTKAGVLASKYRDNIKLHTIYLWEQFGGQHIFREYDDTRRDELDILSDAIKEAKEAERYRLAYEVFEDEERLKGLMDRFSEFSEVEHDWQELRRPKSVEEVMQLIKVIEGTVVTQETAVEVCSLLNTTEEDWRMWDLVGAPWEVDAGTLLELYDYTNAHPERKPVRTLRLLGTILRELQEQLPEGQAQLLTKWLTGAIREPIVIETSEVDTSAYNRIVNHHYDVLKERLKPLFGDGTRQMDKFIVKLFRKVLKCNVHVSEAASGRVTEIKHNLVKHYQQHGHLRRGDASKRALQREAERILAQRIRDDYELNDVEQDYLDNAGKIITIRMPTVIPSVLKNLYQASYVRTENAQHEKQEIFY